MPVECIILVMDACDNCFSPQGFREFTPVLAGNRRRDQLAGIARIDGESQWPALREHLLLPVSSGWHTLALDGTSADPQGTRRAGVAVPVRIWPAGCSADWRRCATHERGASLQPFAEFLLRGQLVRQSAAPHVVRWVRRFLTRQASDEPSADQVRRFCDDLARHGAVEDWQVRQAEQTLRLSFVNVPPTTELASAASGAVNEQDGTRPLAALEQLRLRVRTRLDSARTEGTSTDWVRRILEDLVGQEGIPRPRVESGSVHNDVTHLAVRHGMSAGTQNQACYAILILVPLGAWRERGGQSAHGTSHAR